MTTNYEKLQNSTVEDMANFITNFVLNAIAKNSNRQKLNVTCDVMDTYSHILELLNKESED